jgi:hypothetical protein
MSDQIQNSHISENKTTARGGLIGGIVLILIGVIMFIDQFTNLDFGLLILPALGMIFLFWGLLTQKFGLIIPGGILTSIGAGSLIVTGPAKTMPETVQGGLFMLCFAAGWLAISLLSLFTRGHNHQGWAWWPLIPGSIMALIGVALLQGGIFMSALELLGQGWPLFLIATGLYIIFRRRES